MDERVAVVGLGAMGTPMARRLVDAGMQVSVFDIVAERVQGLVVAGARGARSPAEAVRGAQRILVMVATAPQLRGVLAAVADALPCGATVIVTGTVGVEGVRAAAADLAPRGVSLLDAAVSGGVRRAETGDLLIMTGGDAGLLERCRPLLEILGHDIVHCGDRAGDGQAVKLVNQLLAGVHLAAAAEALAFADALGLDREMVWRAVQRGAGGSFMLQHRGPRMMAGRDAAGDRVLPHFVKDLELVADAAADRGFRPVLAAGALGLFRHGAALDGGRDDDAALLEASEAGPAPELLEAVAQLAGLTLDDERVAALADGFASLAAEQAQLRAASPQAPHMVFDPRWDGE
jgi:3-hydroxyisobutyrate dehydrogenase